MLSYFCNSSSQQLHSREELYASLKKLVSCDVCKEDIHTAAVVCQGGHAVCLECGNGARCPICFNPHLNKRFTAFNKIIEALEHQEGFLEKVVELLECPVCFEDVSVGWRNCSEGHAICGNCRDRTICCPMCRSSYSNFQCTSLVQMLKELQKKVKCKYHQNGCKDAFLKGPELFNHEESCGCKGVSCMVKGCSWTGTVDKVCHHFEQMHQGLITDGKLGLIYGTEGVLMFRARNNSYFLTYAYNNEGILLKYQNAKAKPDNCVGSVLKILNGAKGTWSQGHPRTADGVQNNELFIPSIAIENHGHTSEVRCTFELIFEKNQRSYLAGYKSKVRCTFEEKNQRYLAMMHYAIGGAFILSGCYSLIKSNL